MKLNHETAFDAINTLADLVGRNVCGQGDLTQALWDYIERLEELVKISCETCPRCKGKRVELTPGDGRVNET